MNAAHSTLLYIDNVSVSFDGFLAINQLNLYIDAGELRCIIGPNGAGKSTMMDIVTGKTRPDSGSVTYAGDINLLELDEAAIARAGIGRKFQKPTVFEALTVYENLEVAVEGDRSALFNWRNSLTRTQNETIQQVAETIGLVDQLTDPAQILSHGQKQWLEIGMLLAQKPRLLLVDEPVAGMTHQEMDKTAELLVALAGEHTVVVVEHDMDFVRSLNSRVTVLHQGSVLAEGSMSDIQSNAEVKRVYLGE
jgi:urea transport system ATP-binding protein